VRLGAQGQNCVAVLLLPGHAFSMAQSGSRLVVATSGRQVLIYDLRTCAAGLAAAPVTVP